ncbi:hypothetical protein HDU98_011134 [Podochytrium sp. JEL0797]|nr:hypothetical protein HDU98_011134 [Podochytrium sp. JEL0797]
MTPISDTVIEFKKEPEIFMEMAQQAHPHGKANVFDAMEQGSSTQDYLRGAKSQLGSTSPELWSTEEVGSWLASLQYGEEIVSCFRDQNCDGKFLKMMSATEDGCVDILTSQFKIVSSRFLLTQQICELFANGGSVSQVAVAGTQVQVEALPVYDGFLRAD